jgi:hypothetical protein
MICALAGALGFGAGWWIERGGAAAREPVSSERRISKTLTPNKSASGGQPSVSAHRLDLKSLASRLAISPPVERWLLLVAAVEKAGLDDMPELLKMCSGDKAALQMIASHWADRDPAHMWRVLSAESQKGLGFETLGSLPMTLHDITGILFKSWVAQDLTAARAALNSPSEMRYLDATRSNLFSIFAKADPEASLGLIEEWNIRHIIPLWQGLDKWAEKDPRHAAEVAARSGVEIASTEALKVIGRTWAKTDPAAALAYATSLSAAQRSSFVAGAMKEWAAKDPAAAAAWAASQTDTVLRAQLAKPLVEAWAKTAPDSALAWCQENLRGEARSKAIAGVVEGISQKDPAAASRLIAELDPGGARNTAAGALALKWYHQSGSQAVVQWLTALPDADLRRAGMEQIQWVWQMNEPARVAEFLTGPHASLAGTQLLQTSAAEQARRDPEAAMQWTAKLSPATMPAAREQVLQVWMHSRPEAAAAWLQQQPPDTRTELLTNTAHSLAWGSPETASTFFSSLNAADRVTIRESLTQNTGLDAAKKAELLKALSK